jgi:hypothetical protein
MQSKRISLLGVFRLHKKSYIGEHLDENGDYLIMVEKQKLSLDNDNVISLFILNCLILINIMFILLEFSIIVWPN